MGSYVGTFKEVVISTLPIAGVLLFIQLFMLEPDFTDVLVFLVCVAMVLFGFTIFLVGVEKGINPVGEAMGSEISKRRSRLFMVGLVFAISFLVTVAEPDVGVFATQVTALFSSLDKNALVYAIAIGVAVYLIIAAVKIVFRLNMKVLLTIGYGIVIVLTLMTPAEFIGIAFDSGGVTTGPMTVPILISLGIGLCSIHEYRNELDGYGMVGLASIGPIIALLVMGLMTGNESMASSSETYTPYVSNIWDRFMAEFMESLKSVLIAIIPLTLFFTVFQRKVLFFSWRAVKRMLSGITMASVGVVIFLTAIYTGFIPLATKIGNALAENPTVLILLGFVLGFLVAISEPAVAILAGRVEESSGGNIGRNTVKLVISAGVATFVAIGMAKISFNIDLLYIIIPGYILALILMWLGDNDLVGITFDAGGVATGPMSVAIIGTMYTGIAATKYSGNLAVINGFGVIALIAIAPIIFLGLFSIYIKTMKRRSSV
ncbi:MAG: DUF1538 domain-containing protein [Candidatus Methanomethylophilaceae archaeon]